MDEAKTPKPKGYWEDKEHILSEVRDLMQKRGIIRVPSSRQLEKIGRSDISIAIKRNYGFHQLRVDLGEEIIQTKSWNKDNIVSEVRALMQDYNLTVVPSSNQLKELRRQDLCNAIRRHYGFYQLRLDIGEQNVRVRRGDRKDIEKVKERALRYMAEKGYVTLPSKSIMLKDEQGQLEAAIEEIGFVKFRGLLDVKPIIDYITLEGIKKWPLESTLEKAYEFLQAHPEYHGLLPRAKEEFEKHGQSELFAAVNLSFRGFDKFNGMLLNYTEERRGFDERDLKVRKI